MKSSKPNTIRRFVFLLSAIIVYAFTLLGCVIVTTSSTKPNEAIEGIVYHLPTSYLKVSIESKKDAKGNHSELVVAAGPEIVPDTKARLTLKPSGNELFARNHTFTVTNGLLSSVAIEDEGKIGEIIAALATIAMNVMKFGALPPVSLRPSAGPVGRETETPLNEEIMAALSSIAPGRHDFLFKLTSKSELTDLPGTAKLLGFDAGIEDWTSCQQIGEQELKGAGLNNYKGIATRVLEPYRVKISLKLKLPVLYSNRIAALNQKIEDLDKVIKQMNEEIPDLKRKRDNAPAGSAQRLDLEAKIEKGEKTLKESEQDKNNATQRLSDNKRFLEGTPANKPYEIANQASSILIPDCSPIVKIPLTRAPLGKTKLSLTLNQGILTDYHAEHPSTTLEIVKVPLNISEALVKLPAEILQLKIDYSSKAQALVEQQAKYQDTLKAIAEKIKGPSAYDEQLKALEQEKVILQLQKEIAELKAAISKLESP